MIIKKKYTNIQKTNEETIQKENSPELSSDIVNTAENLSVVPDVKEEINQEKKIEKKDEELKNNNDFDLSIDEIKFDQREERREGTRRRGYRRTQDRNIVSRAQEEAVSIREMAKKEGYEAGMQQSRQDLQELRNKFAEFYNYKEQVFQKVSECIMDISVEIEKKILNKEIETDKESIIPIIKGTIEEINKTENKITLKVMPKDVELVRDKVPEIFSENYFEAKIIVMPDNTIKEGGVIVETSNGIVDATIETQLSIIEKALKKQEE